MGRVDVDQSMAFAEGLMPKIGYFVYRECPATWNVKPHFVSNCDVTYVLKGRARYVINGVTHELGPGDLVCLSQDDTKEAITYKSDLMHCFSMNFTLLGRQGEAVALPFPRVSRVGIDERLVLLFHEILYAMADRLPGYEIETAGLLLSVLHRIFTLTVRTVNTAALDFRLKKICEYIARHYNEKLTVKKLAGLVGLNSAYLGQIFRRELGVSVNRYVTRVRINNAVNMLQSGECGVSDAAESAGFSDGFYFYKQFKKIMGVPPSACIPRRAATTTPLSP